MHIKSVLVCVCVCVCVCVYVVLYCTLLAQAQSNADRQKVVKQMESDAELLKILHQLQETDKEDIVHEERERRQAARKSRVELDLDAMDTDDAGGVVVVEALLTFIRFFSGCGMGCLVVERRDFRSRGRRALHRRVLLCASRSCTCAGNSAKVREEAQSQRKVWEFV